MVRKTKGVTEKREGELTRFAGNVMKRPRHIVGVLRFNLHFGSIMITQPNNLYLAGVLKEREDLDDVHAATILKQTLNALRKG